ncbi:FCF1 [Cordylochernes scorpioides]|uniref:FCF1 n=1 Tax=Cordylochernes scorpioides TaxID=51811 RepID=A0ABY6KBL2_9ARAC|nr:FCF1 [Cordylochernes scorpioides]
MCVSSKNNACMFNNYNMAIQAPYHVVMDTNFVNFSVKNKLDIVESMMDCMAAVCTAYVTDCVVGELEKLGSKFRVALKTIQDPRIKRLRCDHKGTYADDCLVNLVNNNKCYIIGTCDKELKRRIRNVEGIPIMSIRQHRSVVQVVGVVRS